MPVADTISVLICVMLFLPVMRELKGQRSR
jgi:hypothetical protein